MKTLALSVYLLIITIYIISAIVIYHSYKYRGAFKTLLLLLGVSIVGIGIENINVIFDGYYYPESNAFFFIYNCPLYVPLGWYTFVYCTQFTSHVLYGKGRGSLHVIGIGTAPKNGIDSQFIKDTMIRAAFAAYISILFDLIMDPVGVASSWWVWKVDNIYIHGIPFGNYIGWFFVIFWILFFYDIILTWSHIEKKKEITTSAIWGGASVLAMFLAGLILMGFTFWFGVEGVRSDDRIPLNITLTPERWGSLMITLIVVLILIGMILATSLLSKIKSKSQKTGDIWLILPSILMLTYWAVMMVGAFLTSALLVSVAIIHGVPNFFIHLYMIKNHQIERSKEEEA